jgi:hypothetical protein
MKKKKLNLGRKLILQKQTITALDNGQQLLVAGGATNTGVCCLTETCPANSNPCGCIETINCPPNTNPTVGNPCCSPGSLAIDSRCPGIC